MACPACDRPSLDQRDLEPGLRAQCCDSCGGAWLRISAYQEWLRSAGDAATQRGAEALEARPAEPPPGRARRCPDCHTLLGRYRVGHGATFQIDRCAVCNGTWLDRDEWRQLRALGLAAQLQSVFSAEWQQDVRRAEQAETHERRFAARIDTADLARAREIREWLAHHPNRSDILAYLELIPSVTATRRTAPRELGTP